VLQFGSSRSNGLHPEPCGRMNPRLMGKSRTSALATFPSLPPARWHASLALRLGCCLVFYFGGKTIDFLWFSTDFNHATIYNIRLHPIPLLKSVRGGGVQRLNGGEKKHMVCCLFILFSFSLYLLALFRNRQARSRKNKTEISYSDPSWMLPDASTNFSPTMTEACFSNP
jgi:hypothetical protein